TKRAVRGAAVVCVRVRGRPEITFFLRFLDGGIAAARAKLALIRATTVRNTRWRRAKLAVIAFLAGTLHAVATERLQLAIGTAVFAAVAFLRTIADVISTARTRRAVVAAGVRAVGLAVVDALIAGLLRLL